MGKRKHMRKIIPAVFLLMALSFTAGYALERTIPRYEYAEVHGVMYVITGHADIIGEGFVVIPSLVPTFGYLVEVRNTTPENRTFSVWGSLAGIDLPTVTKTLGPHAVETFSWDLGLDVLPSSFTGIFYVSES